jgi:YVTN family beta-propeller protein
VIVNTFSPDEALSYLGHTKDVVVTAVDTTSLDEVQRIEVGNNPQKLGVDPGGRFLYAILTQEGALAVIDTTTWEVARRIPLGTNPTTVFVQALNS